MKVSKETIQALFDLGYRVWGDLNCYEFLEDDQDYETATHLVVYNPEDESYKKLKAPKVKEVTLEWVLERINKEHEDKNLYWMLRKHFDGINIYSASYGVGVCSLFDRECDIEIVKKKLNELGIKYRTELSEAGWVYKFIISKSKDNLSRLQAI